MERITKSPSQTQKLASDFAKKLKGGEVIVLTGELGAGKTEFVKGLARGLGIKQSISSPSFVLMREYTIRVQGLGVRVLVHIDCYRIKTVKEIEELGLNEIFQDKNTVTVIEWGEKIKKILPKKRIEIYFKYLDDINFRSIALLERP